MWTFWILAYVIGLSNHGFYRNFHHVAGGLSQAADQQIASALLWFAAAAAFVPVIFWNATGGSRPTTTPTPSSWRWRRPSAVAAYRPTASGTAAPTAP